LAIKQPNLAGYQVSCNENAAKMERVYCGSNERSLMAGCHDMYWETPAISFRKKVSEFSMLVCEVHTNQK
jgi:hypothetical protein